MSSQFLREILSVWEPQPHLLSPKLQVRAGKLKNGSLPTPPNTIVEAERWVGNRADTSFLVPSAEVGISTQASVDKKHRWVEEGGSPHWLGVKGPLTSCRLMSEQWSHFPGAPPNTPRILHQ